jgi:class 3 adenylate cyclase/tetratricopeptide (TPR) repeat protein
MVGERRIVTMLFCDVKGSTAAAAQFDPEEWAQIINGAFQPMIRPIYRYEGTVARLTGDGLLAFFGAPIAHEDDPQRAVLAGLEILDGIRDYRETVRRQWGIELDVRVGVNTGLVVVGAVGSDLRMEYSALGDAINIAARMEQTARPGTVQIAENTHKLIAPLFDFETIEALEVKGRAEPMTAYRVLGRKSDPGPLRGLAGLSSPLVGRDRELARLTDALMALAGGRGGIVAVMGEAGLGKTRLTAEARRGRDENSGLTWIEGKSLSYDTTTPYAPFRGALAHSAGLRPDMDDNERYAHLKAEVERVLPGRGEEIAPFLAQTMELPVPPGDDERVRFLQPPMLRGMVFQAVTGWLEALAAARPTVLFLDDLHWSDPTSLELLHTLMPLAERAPLLLLLAFRPRRQDPSWQLHETAARDFAHCYTSIALQPLDESGSRLLVSNLLTIEDLPESVRRLILDKSEGNPFFLEEVIRSLLDAGLVVRQGDHWRAAREIVSLRVPDTLVGVITARLDRLDDASRQAAQAAAVLGREFTFDLLADIAGQGVALEESLAILQRRELVREVGRFPERRYIFRHALTQDAAYDSLLLSRRRHLHHMAGDALQRRAPEAAAEIARHYLEARRPADALPFLVRAGGQAAGAYATQEAITHFTRALENEAAGDAATVRAAYEGLGAMQSIRADLRLALSTYQRMLAAAEARGDLSMTISALNKLGGLLGLMMGQFDQAEGYLARAEQLAAGDADPDGFAELSIVRCQVCTAQADFDGVIRYMDGVVASSLRLGNDHNLSLGLGHTAQSLIFLNRFEEARATAEEALALARRIGDRPHEVELLTFAFPLIHIRDGDFERARATLAEGLQLAQRIGAVNSIADAFWLMARIAYLRGEYEVALAAGERSREAAAPLEEFMPFYLAHALALLDVTYLEISPSFADQAAQFHDHALRLLEMPVGAIGGGAAWADLGWRALMLNDLDVAAATFTRGLNYPTMMMNVEKPRYLAGMALLHSSRGEDEPAERLAREAFAFAEQYGLRHLVPPVRLTAGRVLAAAGRHEEALVQFAIAEEAARDMEQRPLLWQTLAAAGRSLTALGRNLEAADKEDQTRAVLNDIAGLFEDEEMRAAFRESAERRQRSMAQDARPLAPNIRVGDDRVLSA